MSSHPSLVHSLCCHFADVRQMGLCRTADEDFGTLLEAAVFYDRRVAALLGEIDSSLDTYPTSSPFPRLLIVVTGIIPTLVPVDIADRSEQ